jgi:peptide/nickel transport system permease protein
MLQFIAKRLLGTLPVLALISFLIFMLLQAAPGDPATMLIGEEATPADAKRLREQWGLDKPAIVQYFYFLASAVRGDFGNSFRFGQPVMELIVGHLPATLELAFLSTLLAVAIGVPFGVWAGAKPNTWIDNSASMVGFFGISMPNFWMGIVLILIVSGYFDLLPTSGRNTFGVGGKPITGFIFLDSILRQDWAALKDAAAHIVLPVTTLGLHMVGIIMRVTRSSVLEVSQEDYVTTARAKGVRESVILWRHILLNALIVIITVVGLEFGSLLSGAIIVETIFGWPGLGTLLIEGMAARDYPLITGLVLVYTTMFVIINVLMDVCYAIIDPRLRFN